VLSVVCATVGLYLSYWLDAAPGGLVVVTQGAAFALVYLFGPRHGLLTRRARRDGAAPPAAVGRVEG
jgi:manganese transport system permease protein